MKRKVFEWTPMKLEPKEDVNLDNPCLIWVYDSALPIGYVASDLAYWLGSRWVDYNGKPVASHPDMEITYWCYVPKARVGRKPGNLMDAKTRAFLPFVDPKNVIPSQSSDHSVAVRVSVKEWKVAAATLPLTEEGNDDERI
jgi:hypothetical protein